MKAHRMLLAAFTFAAAVVVLVVGVVPAGAVAPGASASVTVISPNLDNGFPCGLGNIGPMTSVQAWANNQVPSFATPDNKCTGTIFQSTPGIPNTALFATAGADDAGQALVLAGTGALSGNYYYEEPCQTSSVDGSRSAQTGESYGTLTLNLSQAAGLVRGAPFAGPATITTRFWWSRVGVTALVGVRDAVVKTGNDTVVTAPNATGLAAAVFVETVQQLQAGCTPGPAPAAGSIEIFSGNITITQ